MKVSYIVSPVLIAVVVGGIRVAVLVLALNTWYSSAMVVLRLNVVSNSVTFATNVSTSSWLGPAMVVVRFILVTVEVVRVSRVVIQL